jgi:hypothetical protein
MACILSKGIKLDCSNNTGGVESVWLAPISAISSVTTNDVNGTPQSGDGTVTNITGPVYGYANIVVTIPGATFNHLQFDGDVTSTYTVGTTVQFTADLVGGGVGGFSGPITASTYSPISGETVVNIGSLTTFQMLGSVNYSTLVTGGNVAFLKFETLRNSISFEQPSSINLENGSTFYTHTLQFQIPKQDTSKRNKLYQLAAGNGKFLAIVKDMNGQYWISGLQSDGSMNVALQISTSNAMSGKAKGDMNGYDITLNAELNTLAFKINPSLVALIDGTTNW